jgi:hypothetical protein
MKCYFFEARFKILSNSKMLTISITKLVGMALVTNFQNFQVHVFAYKFYILSLLLVILHIEFFEVEIWNLELVKMSMVIWVSKARVQGLSFIKEDYVHDSTNQHIVVFDFLRYWNLHSSFDFQLDAWKFHVHYTIFSNLWGL